MCLIYLAHLAAVIFVPQKSWIPRISPSLVEGLTRFRRWSFSSAQTFSMGFISGDWRRTPPVYTELAHDLRRCSASVFWVVVLLKTMRSSKSSVQKRIQPDAQNGVGIKIGFHYSVENAYARCSSHGNTSPHVDFKRMLWFSFEGNWHIRFPECLFSMALNFDWTLIWPENIIESVCVSFGRLASRMSWQYRVPVCTHPSFRLALRRVDSGIILPVSRAILFCKSAALSSPFRSSSRSMMYFTCAVILLLRPALGKSTRDEPFRTFFRNFETPPTETDKPSSARRVVRMESPHWLRETMRWRMYTL